MASQLSPSYLRELLSGNPQLIAQLMAEPRPTPEALGGIGTTPGVAEDPVPSRTLPRRVSTGPGLRRPMDPIDTSPPAGLPQLSAPPAGAIPGIPAWATAPDQPAPPPPGGRSPRVPPPEQGPRGLSSPMTDIWRYLEPDSPGAGALQSMDPPQTPPASLDDYSTDDGVRPWVKPDLFRKREPDTIPTPPVEEPAAAAPDGGLTAAPADTAGASLDDDARAAEAALRDLTESDPARGGAIATYQSTPMPPAYEEPENEYQYYPGIIGKAQRWTRETFGLDDDGARNLGHALMRGGAALMQGDANFGVALGEAIDAGLTGYIDSATEIEDSRRQSAKDALERWKIEQDVRRADEALSLARARFEEDKRQAAIDRLDPLAALKRERDFLSTRAELDRLQGGSSGWDDLLAGMSPSHRSMAHLFISGGGTVWNPDGTTTQEFRDYVTRQQDDPLGLGGL